MRIESISHPSLNQAIFERLPLSEQCLTVSRIGRNWRQWAAPKKAELEQQLAAFTEAWYPTPCLPLWSVLEAWHEMSYNQCWKALRRAARCGDLAFFKAKRLAAVEQLRQGGAFSHAGAGVLSAAAIEEWRKWGDCDGPDLVTVMAACSGSIDLIALLQRRLNVPIVSSWQLPTPATARCCSGWGKSHGGERCLNARSGGATLWRSKLAASTHSGGCGSSSLCAP